ncbi:CinA family protein [Sphingomonas rubra]|uniref:Nicotinamide-nucleotide amidase n=1 Tax=Sphingomonas rubra TaxID=634430 RepID=A0A1I5Q157_9SPHN|nr:nicotinamide-nucleotide amidohydrolase family protein [Sphingomonas rubra]SFP39741.1 nicotinamide-nucleotide amidase [Sphingomonas rubra]
MTETLTEALPTELEIATEALLREAHERELMLATAESCTGGMLASLLTDVDGYGHVFDRGFVVYSEHAKCQLLGLAPEQIARCGAVSRDVAVAMAQGALAASDAQVVLAVTGFAGEGAPGDEPGLVHFACARTGRATVHRVEHFGDVGRGAVRIAALKVAVALMAAVVADAGGG